MSPIPIFLTAKRAFPTPTLSETNSQRPLCASGEVEKHSSSVTNNLNHILKVPKLARIIFGLIDKWQRQLVLCGNGLVTWTNLFELPETA